MLKKAPNERHYDTKDFRKAEEMASKTKLPLLIKVGAAWCSPCGTLDKGVLAPLETENLGKFVSLHLDVDEAEKYGGIGAIARNLNKPDIAAGSGIPHALLYNSSGRKVLDERGIQNTAQAISAYKNNLRRKINNSVQ